VAGVSSSEEGGDNVGANPDVGEDLVQATRTRK